MSLDTLEDDLGETFADLDGPLDVDLDRETRNELAVLLTVLEPESPDELVRRGLHMLFQTAVETGNLDFHLRSQYDVTYDEYLSGMTFDEMTGGQFQQQQDDSDDRRYQF